MASWKEMPEFCHRCQAELPEPSPRMEAVLFCPHCSAPQLRLPEYLRVDNVAHERAGAAAGQLAEQSAGQRGIGWRAALPAALWVAAVGAAIFVLGLRVPFVAALGPVWVLISGAIVLGAYLRREHGIPAQSTLSLAKTGWRLGLVSGLLLVGARGVAVAGVGVTARFVTHSMGEYDARSARDAEADRQLMLEMLPAEARGDKESLARYQSLQASPEIKAGTTVAMAGFQGVCVILFAGLGGLFAGTLAMRRRTLPHGR